MSLELSDQTRIGTLARTLVRGAVDGDVAMDSRTISGASSNPGAAAAHSDLDNRPLHCVSTVRLSTPPTALLPPPRRFFFVAEAERAPGSIVCRTRTRALSAAR